MASMIIVFILISRMIIMIKHISMDKYAQFYFLNCEKLKLGTIAKKDLLDKYLAVY